MKSKPYLYKRLLILFLITSSSFQVFACTCSSSDSYFCHYLSYSYHNLYLVTITDSLQQDQRKMQVLETFYINHFPVDTTTMQGSDGVNCGMDLDVFEIGDTLLVAMQPYTYDSLLVLGVCGRSYLRYSDGMLNGPHSPGVNQIDYELFKQEVGQCAVLSNSEDLISADAELNIFPNPTSDQLTFEIANASILSITIYDVDGRTIHLENNIDQTRFSLDVQPFRKGIYFASIKVNDAILTRRFMVI